MDDNTAPLPGSLEALQAKQRAELESLERAQHLTEDASRVLTSSVHQLLDAVNVPQGLIGPVAHLYQHGTDAQLASIVAAPVTPSATITLPDYNGAPSQYRVSVELDTRLGGMTLVDRASSADPDAPSLFDHRREALALQARNNERAAIERGEAPTPSGQNYGYNSTTKRWEHREPLPSEEQVRTASLQHLGEAAGPLAHPEQVAELERFVAEHYDDDKLLATKALVKRYVPGPEGGMVTTIDLMEWTPDTPYPAEAHDVVTARQLKVRAREMWRADYYLGPGVGAFYDQGAFADEAMGSEFRLLRGRR